MKLGTKAGQLKWEDAEQAAPPPPLPSLDLASTQPAALLDMWQHVVDGLTEQIALLDEDWTILVVNQSWVHVAEL